MAPASQSVRSTASPAPPAVSQFDIPAHYNVMAELDRDVHDDLALSATEANLTLRLIGDVPRRMFMPCCGTGRHIVPFRQHDVRRIVGVDLSPRCLTKAAEFAWLDLGRAVHLARGDLATWRTREEFDAAVCLGNSFGDIVDPEILAQVTVGMVHPVRQGGVVIFDYIGKDFLDQCREGRTNEWDATLCGRPVRDRRTPRFDQATRIMTIDVVVTAADNGTVLWTGFYQKRVLSDTELVDHFASAGVRLERMGLASELNRDYYGHHAGNLGMIARSTWWRGVKTR